MNNETEQSQNAGSAYMNPYLAGVLLGLTLLASYILLGAGLGASGGIARIGAFLEGCVLKSHTLSSGYFGKWGANPLNYYLVFMFVGVVLGGLFSSLLANRTSLGVEKGKKASRGLRLGLAMIGGLLVGFASRLAQGCTSGQALTGSALLLSGSLLFLVCLFAGGYAAAWFVRRQWDD